MRRYLNLYFIFLFSCLAVNASNYLTSSPEDWQCVPETVWEINCGNNDTVLTATTKDKSASYAVMDLVGKIDLQKNREFILSGWMNVDSNSYMRDATAVIAIVGDYGYRDELREFQSEGKWVYFEKRLDVPEIVKNLRLIIYARIWPGVVSFKSLSLVDADEMAAAFKYKSSGDISKRRWHVNNREYRICGEVSSDKGNQPLWVDFDVSRLLLLSGSRDPIDPSSIVVVGIDGKGKARKVDVAFSKPLSNLADHYKRNGTFKWRTIEGVWEYEIYFNTASDDGARDLILDKHLGLGELLNYAPDAHVPVWAGWPGGWLDIKDVDGDGDLDIYANNTDAGIWLLRNIGSDKDPLFLPRQKPTVNDKLVETKTMETPVDWDNDGRMDTLVWEKHKRGGYIEGVWARIVVRFSDGKNVALTDVDGRDIIFDNATWSQLACGDFDGDGFVDIAAGTADSDMQILVNKQTSKLRTAVEKKSFEFNTYSCNKYDSGDMSLKPHAIDWNKDGRSDIVLTGWNGFVFLILNENVPGKVLFRTPSRLEQLSGKISVADSPTPDVVDWDGDGRLDIVCADVNGNISFFRNKGDYQRPAFEYAGRIRNDKDEPIRITAQKAGATIQGAVEKCWGYLSCQCVDVDRDGDIDIVINDSLGRLRWIENVGSRRRPVMSSVIRPFLENSLPLITPWRNRPGIADWEGDGVMEITVLEQDGSIVVYNIDPDHPDYLTRKETLFLTDGSKVSIFQSKTPDRSKGRSQFDTADWDGDGDIDIMIGRPRGSLGGGNILYLENVGTKTKAVFEKGVLKARGLRFAEWTGSDGHDQWHSGGPCMVDWNNDGKMDLIHGCESGRLAYYEHDFFVGENYPVFKAETFERKNEKDAVVIFDFSNDVDADTEFLVPIDSPIQWLADEKKCLDEVENRSVQIISPKSSVVSGDVVFEATASGTGINLVDFYVDGKWIAKEGVPPYIAFGDENKWNTSSVSNGRHILTVKVTYLDGSVIKTEKEIVVKN